MTATSPNFILLDSTRPDIANLVAAMVQARDAVKRRSWSHPQEPTGEEWWADVLADPRSQTRAAHRSRRQASVLSARRRKARDHTCRVQQVRFAGRLCRPRTQWPPLR